MTKKAAVIGKVTESFTEKRILYRVGAVVSVHKSTYDSFSKESKDKLKLLNEAEDNESIVKPDEPVKKGSK